MFLGCFLNRIFLHFHYFVLQFYFSEIFLGGYVLCFKFLFLALFCLIFFHTNIFSLLFKFNCKKKWKKCFSLRIHWVLFSHSLIFLLLFVCYFLNWSLFLTLLFAKNHPFCNFCYNSHFRNKKNSKNIKYMTRFLIKIRYLQEITFAEKKTQRMAKQQKKNKKQKKKICSIWKWVENSPRTLKSWEKCNKNVVVISLKIQGEKSWENRKIC